MGPCGRFRPGICHSVDVLHDVRTRGTRWRQDVAASARDLVVAGIVVGWIGAVLLVDAVPLPRAAGAGAGGGSRWASGSGPELGRQVVLGLATWLVLRALLRRETAVVRTQTLVVVALATCVEYTFSPLLEAYVYRIGTVPFFVPPGHGLVYLAAVALGRSAVFRAHGRLLVAGTVLVGGTWAVARACRLPGRTRWERSGSPASSGSSRGAGAGCSTSARSSS